MIGIIGAMVEEVEALIGKLENVECIEKTRMKYYKGTLNGKEAVVVKCGIGKVNAAVCAQSLIDNFNVEVIINTGVAGSLKNEIDIADIVISTDTVNHDFDTTAFGDDYGVISYMDTSFFPADKGLIEKTKKVCEEFKDRFGTYEGRVLSGDQFIASEEKKQWLKDTFHGVCCEMEGAAIGQAAYLNDVPYVILRAISDKGDNSAMMSYEDFKAIAINNLTDVVTELVKSI